MVLFSVIRLPGVAILSMVAGMAALCTTPVLDALI